jgi:hypothetical protein
VTPLDIGLMVDNGAVAVEHDLDRVSRAELVDPD